MWFLVGTVVSGIIVGTVVVFRYATAPLTVKHLMKSARKQVKRDCRELQIQIEYWVSRSHAEGKGFTWISDKEMKWTEHKFVAVATIMLPILRERGFA